jgi:hypothetical protein
MRPARRTVFSLALAASVLSVVQPSGAALVGTPPQTMLVSRGSSSANGPSPGPAALVPDTTSPSLSLDGLSVAFSSTATNLVAGDTNGAADIFVRRSTSVSPWPAWRSSALSRVSTTADGKQANGASYSPVLSVDATRMAFISRATNLVPGDTNGVADVFFKNLVTGYIRRVSVTPGGTQANAASRTPFISLFGEHITFESAATTLSSGDTNGLPDAFLWTRASGALRRIVPPQAAEQGLIEGTVRTGSASISHDGKTLAYHRLVVNEDSASACAEAATAVELVQPGSGACVPLAADVFVEAPYVWEPRRCVPATTTTPRQCFPGKWHGGTEFSNRRGVGWQRIAMQPWGGSAKKMLENPVVTGDGRYVAYEAWSAITLADTARTTQDRTALYENNLDALCPRTLNLPTTPACDVSTDRRTIYMYDWWLNVHFPVSTNLAGPVANKDCRHAAPNAYGTVIAFECDATNMVAGDTNDATDVFVKDLPGRVTSRMSVSATHGEGFGRSTRPSISYEGRRVAFASDVSTFVGGDTNGASDIFLRDRRTEVPNQVPALRNPFPSSTKPFTKTQGLDVLETFRFTMVATDADADVLRYGAITKLPDGARIDPVTGVFTWNPSPHQTEVGGKMHQIVLWAGDPRGAHDLELIKLYVRDPGGTARCDLGTAGVLGGNGCQSPN